MKGMHNKKIAKKKNLLKRFDFFSQPHGLSVLLIELEIRFKRKWLEFTSSIPTPVEAQTIMRGKGGKIVYSIKIKGQILLPTTNLILSPLDFLREYTTQRVLKCRVELAFRRRPVPCSEVLLVIPPARMDYI